jgi:hypothetical protein
MLKAPKVVTALVTKVTMQAPVLLLTITMVVVVLTAVVAMTTVGCSAW